MSESDEALRGWGERLRPGNKQIQTLFGALEEFLAQPRAADALLGEWLHDENLIAPSAEVLEFFAWDMFYGFGRHLRFIEASSDCYQAVRNHAIELISMPMKSRWNTIVYAMARRRIIELSGQRLHVLHWWPAIAGFESDSTHTVQFEAGRRRLARFFLESMTLRASFLGEAPYLEGLVAAVKGTPQKPQACHELAVLMIEWIPHLRKALGRDPSKNELESFLCEVYPDLTDAAASWNEARKLVHLPYTNLRGKKIDKDAIVKLALLARETGPIVSRIPLWRSSRMNEFQK